MNVHKKRANTDRLPDCLHGPIDEAARTSANTRQPEEHPHAFSLAEDHDNDGLIDHVLVHADAGLSLASLQILLDCRHFYLPGQKEN